MPKKTMLLRTSSFIRTGTSPKDGTVARLSARAEVLKNPSLRNPSIVHVPARLLAELSSLAKSHTRYLGLGEIRMRLCHALISTSVDFKLLVCSHEAQRGVRTCMHWGVRRRPN